jgi:parallel beta-helix repeat protein
LVTKLAIVCVVIAGSLLNGAPAGKRREGVRPPSGQSAARHSPTAREARAASAGAVTSKRVREAAATPCNRYAAPWGSKRGNGSLARPFRGPYRLVRALQAGETGCLRNGTYQERETIVRRRGVTLRTAPGERATWRGRVVLQGRADRLLGLSLDGSYGPRCPQRGCGTLPSPTINATGVVIAYDDITSPGSGICVHPRAWHRQRPDHFLIFGNRVHDCGRMPHTEHDHGIYVADGSGGEISDNVVFGNADRGIQLYPNAHGTVVAHNTVDGNGSGVVFSERSSGNQVRDNVFTNSVVRWNAETYNLSGSGNRFLGNCVRAANRDPQYNENGGVALPRQVIQHGNRRTHDSVYVARRAADYRVLPTSACAGKGAPDWVAAPVRP